MGAGCQVKMSVVGLLRWRGTQRNAEASQRDAEEAKKVLSVSLRLPSAFLCVPLTLEKPRN
jgi:hypothetical protein